MKKFIFFFLLCFSQLIFSQITFNADFDSGSFKDVTTSDSTTFYVTTNTDIGGRWFYFRIAGVKDKFIKVVVTTDFNKAMYSYDNKNYIRFSDSESPEYGTFQKTFEQDTVYVSYYTPYPYEMMQENLAIWKQNNFVQLDTIGFTQNLLPMQEMIVTDQTIDDTEKFNVWIHARTHPSETPSSWQFEGIVRELLSNDEVINFYLSKIKFHLIPFSNPDGVFYGRSRTNFNFVDVEREWDKPELETCLEVRALKTRMAEISNEKPFSVFLNLHSQAASYCTFWIHNRSSTSEYFYRREYQFSNLCVADNPYFTKNDYSESSLKSHFPEGWLWNNYGDQVMALTYETPYDNYFKSSNEPFIEVTNENLFEIGRRTVYAIAEYLELSHPRHYIMDNSNAIVNGDNTIYNVGLDFYSDDFAVLETNADDTYVIFNSDNLPSGSYDVSAWWATSSGNSYETVFEINAGNNSYEVTKTQKVNGGQWNYLTEIELPEEGNIYIKVKSNSTGLVVADAIRLIYNGPVTSVETETIPSKFSLSQNYPNPFNPTTTIRYSIPTNSVISNPLAGERSLSSRNDITNVSLKVYDILGSEVATLVNESKSPGEYEATFNAFDLASGTYIYTLRVGSNLLSKKMLLLK